MNLFSKAKALEHVHEWGKWETVSLEFASLGEISLFDSSSAVAIQRRECGTCGKLQLDKVQAGPVYCIPGFQKSKETSFGTVKKVEKKSK
jgi:hypothetical protein